MLSNLPLASSAPTDIVLFYIYLFLFDKKASVANLFNSFKIRQITIIRVMFYGFYSYLPFVMFFN